MPFISEMLIILHVFCSDPLKAHVMLCSVTRGVNPQGLGGRDPPDFGQGGRGRVMNYYYILSYTGSMFESGDL